MLEKIPGAKTAFFPEPASAGVLFGSGMRSGSEEGKSLLFDDTFNQEIWHETDGTRVILFVDVLRPLPYLMGLLKRTIIKAIAASAFVRDAKRNHDAWERQMAEVWN